MTSAKFVIPGPWTPTFARASAKLGADPTSVSTPLTSDGRYVTAHRPTPCISRIARQLDASSVPRARAGRVPCECPPASAVPGWGRLGSIANCTVTLPGDPLPWGHDLTVASTAAAVGIEASSPGRLVPGGNFGRT